MVVSFRTIDLSRLQGRSWVPRLRQLALISRKCPVQLKSDKLIFSALLWVSVRTRLYWVQNHSFKFHLHSSKTQLSTYAVTISKRKKHRSSNLSVLRLRDVSKRVHRYQLIPPTLDSLASLFRSCQMMEISLLHLLPALLTSSASLWMETVQLFGAVWFSCTRGLVLKKLKLPERTHMS